MNRLLKVLAVALALFAGLGFARPANADAPYSQIVVFGDSLSDTGNVFLATGGAEVGPPYYRGRFSNGPVWVEVLAQELGLPVPRASLAGGTNYAWGGAETGPGLSFFDTPNVGMQIDFFLADRGGLVGDELIVVAAGSNDLFWQAPFSPAQIAKNLAHDIRRLANAGGQTFLVPNLVAIGETPLFRGTPDENRLNVLATEVNRQLSKELDDLENSLGITILRFDMAGVLDAMLLMPGEFGLSNVTDPAWCEAENTIVPNPDEYLFWDVIHPTRVAHEIAGEAAANVVRP